MYVMKGVFMNSHDWIGLVVAILTAIAGYFGGKHGASSGSETEKK